MQLISLEDAQALYVQILRVEEQARVLRRLAERLLPHDSFDQLAYERQFPGMLVIDVRALTSPLKYESFDSNLPFPFPHIYGPLNRDAILELVKMRRAADGTFQVPPFPANE